MIAEVPATRRAVCRPMDERSELNYVCSTTAAALASLHGGRFAHRPTIEDLVAQLIARSAVNVVTLEGDRAIMGFVALSSDVTADMTVEFIYLRQSVSRRNWIEEEWGTGRRTLTSPLRPEEMAASDMVAQALLGVRRTFTARRPIHPRVLEAVVHAGYTPSVVPGSI